MASAPDAFSSTSLGSQGKQDEELGDFFELLDLHEEEFDDVIVEEEAPDLVEEIPWLALARVQTLKKFSQAAFFKDMRAAWNTAKPVRFRPIGANLFVIQAQCLGDWDRIMSQGPWLFRNMAVIFAPYDDYSEATDVLMVHMPIWIQIHKLLDGYCRVDVVEKLLRSSGEILEIRIAGNSRGDYIRVRVKHDVRKPLTKFVSIVKGKVRSVFAVRYEKLARFCKACGIIGHDHKECGNDVYAESDLKFGDYLYADPSGKFKSDREPSRSDKAVPASPAAKVPSDKGVAAVDRELKDTASSPVKKDTSLAMEVDKSARKRLLVEQDEGVVHTQEGKMLLLTDGKEAANLDSPITSSDSKRAKKDDGQSDSDNLSAGSQVIAAAWAKVKPTGDLGNVAESLKSVMSDLRKWSKDNFGHVEKQTLKLRRELEFNPGSASAQPSGDRPLWKLIWDTKVPPKLKNFAWQVASGSLPTDVEKKRRHFDLNGFCQVCDREQESSFHALLACPHAANLWDTMRLYWPLPDRLQTNFTGKEWLFTLLDEAPVSVRSRIIMVLWRSWYVRNEIIHGKTPPPLDVSSAFLQSYHNTFSQISSSVEDILKGKSPLIPDQASPLVWQLQAYCGHGRQRVW
ncbi:hypothetical protein D1007_20004 [Hordeum vulgare]|nr:hypothetical protein D1007_20004 [Hordeum vulgare]